MACRGVDARNAIAQFRRDREVAVVRMQARNVDVGRNIDAGVGLEEGGAGALDNLGDELAELFGLV